LRAWEHGQLGPGWRNRGASASPAAFEEQLWAGVLSQSLIRHRASGEHVGWVQVLAPDFVSGVAHLAVARPVTCRRHLTLARGVVAFVDLAFQTWPFRKLYLETAEFTLPQVERLVGGLLDVEYRRLEVIWFDGRLWDQVGLALTRTAWERSDLARRFRLPVA
jgi:hypothetical protein